MGYSYPGSERTLEILRSRSQLKPLCFFRETQIIKEKIILGSSVMYLHCRLCSMENILPEVRTDEFVCFVGCSECN